MISSKRYARIRAGHFAFSVLYGVAAMFFIFTPVALLSFEITFQLALLLFSLVPGTMIFMISIREERWVVTTGEGGELLTTTSGAQIRVKKVPGGTVKRSKKVKLCCALFIAGLCALIALINPAMILLSECPDLTSHHPPHHHHQTGVAETRPVHGAGDTITSHHNNTLDLLIKYNEYDEATDQIEEHALMLKYNLSSKHIERRVWRAERASWRTQAAAFVEQASEPVCTRQTYARFHFLEDEVRAALDERRSATESRKSLRIVAHDNNRGQTTEEEDAFDHHRRMRRICRNEQTFIYFYIIFICGLFLLDFVALLWYTFAVDTRTA